MAAQTGRRLKGEPSVTDFASSVGERIRIARQLKGWTQVQLAEAAGLSSNYVARLERGELGASLYVAQRLAEALDCTLDGLTQSASSGGSRTTVRRRAG